MARIVEQTVYKFEELNDSAKERAREWWRGCNQADSDWYDSVYEMAATAAEMIGIDLVTRPVKMMGGGTRMEPCIWFSGFSSQGDGACFEGTYRYQKGALKKLKSEFGGDTLNPLMEIAEGLYELQRHRFYGIKATVQHRGHYYHSLCTDIDVECFDHQDREIELTDDEQESVKQLMRDFMDLIYKWLEDEDEYINSDEQVDESIIINEYEFDENGELA